MRVRNASGEDYYWHLETGRLSWETPPDESEKKEELEADELRSYRERAADDLCPGQHEPIHCATVEDIAPSLIATTSAGQAPTTEEAEAAQTNHVGSDDDMEVEDDPGDGVQYTAYGEGAPLRAAAQPNLIQSTLNPPLPPEPGEEDVQPEAAFRPHEKKRQSPAVDTADHQQVLVGNVPSKNPSRKAPKSAAHLMNKWHAVQRQLREEESAEVDSDDSDGLARAAAEERKKNKQVEQWRLEVLRNGPIEDNANFAVS